MQCNHGKLVASLVFIALSLHQQIRCTALPECSHYLQSYYVALQSRQQHAPALFPVLIVHGEISEDAVRAIKALGGHVVNHQLSFVKQLLQHRPDVPSALIGSWLRLDVVEVLSSVKKALGKKALNGVDTEYVLWTDPDIMLMDMIDSCTLPKPDLLAMGPDGTPGNKDNAAVIYYNVKGYAKVFPDLLSWADHWKFDYMHDQEMLVYYFVDRGTNYLQQLPDNYNWKPYWGWPPEVAPWSKPAALKILHTHGPKPGMALCALQEMESQGVEAHGAVWWIQQEENKQTIHEKCHCDSKVAPCEALYHLIAISFQRDRGSMFRETQQLIQHYTDQVNAALESIH